MSQPRSPRVLAIDTAGSVGGLAVAAATGECIETVMRSPDGFGHVLFGEIERLLERAGCRLGEIDCFAAGAGPGSFTGVRVAMSAAKGLAEACGKPMFAVSNLQALALHGAGPLRAPVIDARRGEVYGAVYSEDSRLVAAEMAGDFAAWQRTLPGGVELVHGSAVTGSLAPSIARIALARYVAGDRPDPAGPDANYVRRSDAEMKWRE